MLQDPVRRHRVPIALATTLLAALAAAALLAAPRDPGFPAGVAAGLSVLGGCSFVVVALSLTVEQVAPRVRALLLAVGTLWLLAAPAYLPAAWLRLPAIVIGSLWLAVLVHLLLAFPDGRLRDRPARATVAAAYPLALLIGVTNAAGLAAAAFAPIATVQIGFGAALVVVLARRWASLPAPLRRAQAPVLLGGGAALAGLILVPALRLNGLPAASVQLGPIEAVVGAVLTLLPAGFAVVVGRTRLDRAAVADLAVTLSRPASPIEVRDALARALHDDSLRVGYWRTDRRQYVEESGTVLVPAAGSGSTEIRDSAGDPVALLLHSGASPERRRLLEAVASTARLALENARLRADLAEQIAQVRASRTRLVAAADAERRRLERNLHDGAQQRMINAALGLSLLKRRLPAGPGAAEALDGVLSELQGALADVREIANGLHPAILTSAGLEPAIRSLVERARVPASADVDVPARLPATIEETAYYIVAECLANATKHAPGAAVTVGLRMRGPVLQIRVGDDGPGGADLGGGTGLRGLADRADAVGGRLMVHDHPHGGTVVKAELPCEL